MDKWIVINTPMWPACWKVTEANGFTSNSTNNYFRNRNDAEKEANRRNKLCK